MTVKKFALPPKMGDKAKVYIGDKAVKFGTVIGTITGADPEDYMPREVLVLAKSDKPFPLEECKYFLPEYKVRFV
jgi:hypothetical protein